MYRVRASAEGVIEGDIGPAADVVSSARHAVALTGAGISVESGIPDFRSPGGLWSRFNPMEYATLRCFLETPEKAWRLYRALGSTLSGKVPNAAHRALARLEAGGRLAGIVTQNVDGLHRAAGSRVVHEIHGEHARLQCLACGRLEPMEPRHLDAGPVPRCAACGRPLKPNVVLFEESVRCLDSAAELLRDCDVLLVAGTSALVSPACFFPEEVLARGGSIVEFNLEPTRLTLSGLGPHGVFVEGPVGATLPAVARHVLDGAGTDAPEA